MSNNNTLYLKWFDTVHLGSDIKSHSVKGGFNTLVAQGSTFLMTILSTTIMARLVTPEGFGVVAMVNAFTGFVLIFSDLGVSSAVIQTKEINQRQVSTLFWINVMACSLIALTVFALAPLIARFYNEPRLFGITVTLASGIFVTGFSIQHNALLKRQMKFKRISVIHIISTLTSIGIGVGMAWFGLDYWAVVSITVSYLVIHTFLNWLFCDWRPSMVFDIRAVKSFIRFGMGVAGFDVINYFSRNADSILIGKYIGSIALGLYSKSYQLLMLPITQLRNPLNTVAIPALGTMQHDDHKYRQFYRRYLFILAFFSMPLVVTLGVFSEEVISVVLGNQWYEAASIFKILAVCSFVQPLTGTVGLVMISRGETKKYFIYGVVNAVFTIMGFTIGLNWGIEGVATSYVLVNYLLLLPFLKYGYAGSPVSISLFFQEIAYPAIFSVLAALVCVVFKSQFQGYLSDMGMLFSGVLLAVICYLAPWFFFKEGKTRLNYIWEIKSFIGKQ